ncbi:leukotriene B4 receptor 2a [Chanos chanos]|uniref:Leukotriene B4 receptor 2a n=1 Tax=Chanos chanos TaxID=29144 RepID=A0A6J2VQK5_CHACN|nr:leukotriene B4 receptor 1-like [Chanos chanos]
MAQNTTLPTSYNSSVLQKTAAPPLFPQTPFFSSSSSSFFHNTSPPPNSSNSVGEDSTILSNSGGTLGGALILGLVFILGVPGNFFIIWSVLARVRQRSITTLLILNLAFADGSLMVLTPFFLVYLVKRSWVFGVGLCKLLFYLCCANMYASIFLIMLMSLYRLVAVVWPRRIAALTKWRSVLRVIACMWTLVLVVSVPVLVFRDVKRSPVQSFVCNSYHSLPAYTALQYLLETFLGFLLPYGVIVGSYVCILRRIRRTRFRRKLRSEKLILAIVITFGLFWLPYHIINLVQVAAELSPAGSPLHEKLESIWKSCRALTSTVAFVSSCVNPVLYTFAAKSYIRREGLAFMARLFEGAGLDVMRKSRQSSQNSRERDKDRDGEGAELQDKESESISSTNATANLKIVPLKNGK